MMPQLQQDKISGLSIAWGRGVWDELEPGEHGFVFSREDSFKYTITPQQLIANGVSEEDLFDCIDQIEANLGDPAQARTSMGLLPDSGYANVGITVRSNTNPDVLCVFTPTSIGPSGEDRDVEGYFEWYFDPTKPNLGVPQFMAQFDMLSGNRELNMISSPIVPGYAEACEKTQDVMHESQRDAFLAKVWNYHKNVSKGFRHRLEREIVETWAKVVAK